MTAARNNSRLGVVAFLIALAFLGHDVSMAGVAHAAAAPDPTGSAHHAAHADSHPTRHADGSPTQPAPAGSDHSTDCGISRPVVSSPRDDHALPPSGAVFDSLSLPALSTHVTPPWDEPSAPPGVRRALVQVWRI